MKYSLPVKVFVFCSSLMTSCQTDEPVSSDGCAILYDLLNQNLWDSKNSYDAGHFLMVPLHFAYNSSNKKLMLAFEEHFGMFLRNKDSTPVSSSRLSKLHYLYLLSQYLNLSGQSNELSSALYDYLMKEIESIWLIEPAWQWDTIAFQNMNERIKWKLKTHKWETRYSYYSAVVDEEIFVVAIACDLKSYLRKVEKEESLLINEICDVGFEILSDRIVYEDTGYWYFQKGYWTDHRDYFFSGNEYILPDLKIKKVDDIAEDSSHSHRWPLWLESFKGAFLDDKLKINYISNLQSDLERALFDNVLTHEQLDGSYVWLMKNFMDGRNTIYRYNYETLGKGNGIGPFQLSGTLLLGWWTFLRTERIRNVYVDISKSFPLRDNLLIFYYDNSSRDRNPYFKNSDTNGLKLLMCLMAGSI